VLQFQFVQEELDRLVVRVVPHPGTGAQDLEQMVKRIPPMLTETIGSDVRVEVELCDEIPLTSGGKHLLVISKVDPDSWLRRSES
jgi:phenylacetate-coenzyme A ligase PaaK-like adenylate-forming protein